MNDRKDPIDAAKGGKERGWRFYAISALLALALIFVLQNTEEAQVSFLFAKTSMPLFFALVISMLLGAAVGWLTPRVRRGGRTDD